MKGFLLIDKQKNSVVIPLNNEFLKEYFKGKELYDSIRKHKTQAELLNEVKKYLRGDEND